MKFKRIFLLLFIFVLIVTNVYGAYYYKLDSEGNVIKYDDEGKLITSDEPIEHLDKIKPVLDYLKEISDKTRVKVSDEFLKIEGLKQKVEIPLNIPIEIRKTSDGLELFRDKPLMGGEEVALDLTNSEVNILNHHKINIGGTLYSLFDGRLILGEEGVSLEGKFFSFNDDYLKYYWEKEKSLKLSQIITEKKVIYKKENDGSFTLEITDHMDPIEIAGTIFNNFKDAKFKVDKGGNLLYASFEVENSGETYEFEYKGKKYVLESQGECKVMFNPIEGIIETDGNIKIKIDDYSVSAGKKTVVKFDEEGDLTLITSESGTFYLDEENPSVTTQLSVERGTLRVVFNKDDFLNEMAGMGNNQQEDGIIFVDRKGEEEREIYLGGKINGVIENIQYSVMSDSALTIYNSPDKFFDVIEGNVRITNEVYELNIRGGEAFLKKINHHPDALHQSFSFKHRNIHGDEVTGYIDAHESKYHYNGFEVNLNRIGFTRELGMDFMQASDEERRRFSLESMISDLKTEIAGLSGHSKTSKQIDLIKNEMQLKILKGESYDVDADIKRVRQLVQNLPSNSELRAPGESFLGDLLLEKAKSVDAPRLYQRKFREQRAVSYGQYSVDRIINLQVDSRGNVLGYYVDGVQKRITDDFSNLPTEARTFLSNIRNNGWKIDDFSNLENLRRYDTKHDLYEQRERYLGDAQRYYQSARNNFGNDLERRGEVDLMIASSYSVIDNHEESVRRLREIYGDVYASMYGRQDYSAEVRKQAALMAARILVSEEPMKNAREVYDLLNRADTIIAVERAKDQGLREIPVGGPVDSDVESLRREINNLYLLEHRRSAFSEFEMTNQEMNNLISTAPQNFFRDVRDSLWITFQPATVSYLTGERFEEFLKLMDANYNIGERTHIASTALIRMNEYGVSLSEFLRQSPHEQFFSIYASTGEEAVLSSEVLRRYIGDDLFEGDAGQLRSRLENVLGEIEKDYGQQKKQLIEDAINRIIQKKIIIDEAIIRDPTLYMIATEGQHVEGLHFKGDIVNTPDGERRITLNDAFSMTRLGSHIGYTTTERWLLTAADAVLSPLTYLGISGSMTSFRSLSYFVAREAARDLAWDLGMLGLSEAGFAEVASAIGLVRLTRTGIGVGRMGYGLSKPVFERVERLFRGLSGHRDLRYGVVGELPIVVGSRKVGDTFTSSGQKYVVLESGGKRYIAELDALGNHGKPVALLMSEAPGAFKEWDGSLADNLRRNSFEANSVDVNNRQRHLNDVLFESRHVNNFRDRRVHGFEISRQQITPSTDDLRVDIGIFNRGELTLAETAQLTDNQRIAYVQKLLGIDELNENQARAILAAHYSELADVSSYRRLRVKEEILREVFDKDQVSLMMRRGVTGDSSLIRQNNIVTRFSTDGSIDRTAISTDRLQPSNKNQIFSHIYNPKTSSNRGAKAIIYIDEDGKSNIRFWSTGEGEVGNNIHHRDALATLVAEEGNGLIQRGYSLEDNQIFERGFQRVEIAKEMGIVRQQSSFPQEILRRSQGFQFTLDERSGKIIKFEVSSSITSAQISSGNAPSAEELSRLINEVHQAISPELRGYRSIDIERLSDMGISGAINAPAGLSIREIRLIIPLILK